MPPLDQVLEADVDVAQCTQIPVANAPTGLKRMRKERQSKELASGGGDYAEATKAIEIEQGDLCSVWIGGHDVADAHARERCTKRARTSAS